MTLYNQADANIRKTWLLMSVFFVLVIALGWLLSRYFDSPVILYLAVMVSIFSTFGSYWWSDKMVLAMTRAKPIQEQDNRALFHIVENLCISAGLPLPKIYIMPEAQPNAFATGRDARHAAVVVTSGLLAKLNKTELEGVIAHELSHIKNRDALLQTIVVVLAGIVAILSDFFLRMSYFGNVSNRNDNENSRANIIFFLLTLLAGLLAPLAATLIKLAISRKREFLADASGALLTRYPEGLASALEKIALDSAPMRSASPSTAHLFISSPFKQKSSTNWFLRLFLTHPPVQERIKALRDLQVG